jgi:probable rRNA maturation factor
VTKAEIARRARAMMAALQLDDCEWSIVLTSDDQIQDLNALYRNKNRPTDVLAFPQREGLRASPSDRVLGDVVVSVPTARRQASRAGRDALAEITMLLAHGLLHLLGWDHETPSKDRRMRAETRRLCTVATATSRRSRR